MKSTIRPTDQGYTIEKLINDGNGSTSRKIIIPKKTVMNYYNNFSAYSIVTNISQ